MDRDLKVATPSFAPISEPTNLIAGNTAPHIIPIKLAVADKAPLAIAQGIVAVPIVNLPEQTQNANTE